MRAVGNLQNLIDAAGPNGSVSNHGLGHTRWATHGAVTEQNAHPLTGCPGGKVAIVLNGIVENYRELRASLQKEGHKFHTETDAEVVTHLVERHYAGDLVEAVRAAYAELEGHYAFVVIHHDHPDMLIGARHQCPLVVGVGEGEMFLASATTAFLNQTRRIQLVEDGEVVEITPEGARFFNSDGPIEHKEIEPVEWDDEQAEKGGYETFMLKEIYEQPDAVRETIGDRIRPGAKLELEGLGLSDKQIQNLRRIVILACGTAYHAGVVGRYIIEEWARLPVEPDIASEWIYRNPVLSKDTLVIGISQSGETRDTVAAMRLREGGRLADRRDHEPDGLADHARGRLGPLHALRARGRRRRLEDVHRAGVAADPRRAQARAGPPHALGGGPRLHPRRGLQPARTRSRSSSTATTRSRTSRSATTRSRSSCTSDGTSACRSRSRARSS